MSETLEVARLRVLYYCHLAPITVQLTPTLTDPKLFPNAKDGFESFPMVTQVSRFGQKYAMADISGLTDDEVQHAVKKAAGHFWTDPLTLLRALEYLEGEYGFSRYPELTFTRVVAYHGPSWVTVAERLPSGGFKRLQRENPHAPWEQDTVGLFFIDSL